MGHLLNLSTQMMCPHGGTVSITSANSQAKAGGDFIILSSDTFTISGCPFMVGPAPHPCMTVKWTTPAHSVRAAGDFVLNEESVGLCLAADQAPQGPPQIVTTQQEVSGT